MRAVFAALRRGRIAIVSVAATYAASVLLGIAMVGTGNVYALERRDEIVGAAQSTDTLVAYRSGERLRAALLDFGANLGLGGLTSTALGLGVVVLYPVVAYRGWVGGIVSVDREHESRLGDVSSAAYYLVTLVLQLIPYSIAGGMGVRVGIGAWRALRQPTRTWLGMPIDLLRDAALAYVVIVPLFLIASLFEFYA